MDGHFRKEMPRHFEFPHENPRRYAAVRADALKEISHFVKIVSLRQFFGLIGL